MGRGGQGGRRLEEAQPLPAARVERAQQLARVGVGVAQAVVEVDRDREEADERDDQQLRREPEAEHEHEQRRDHGDRHGLRADHERAQRAPHDARDVHGDAERRAQGDGREQPGEARDRPAVAGDGVEPHGQRRVERRHDRQQVAGVAAAAAVVGAVQRARDEDRQHHAAQERGARGLLPRQERQAPEGQQEGRRDGQQPDHPVVADEQPAQPEPGRRDVGRREPARPIEVELVGVRGAPGTPEGGPVVAEQQEHRRQPTRPEGQQRAPVEGLPPRAPQQIRADGGDQQDIGVLDHRAVAERQAR